MSTSKPDLISEEKVYFAVRAPNGERFEVDGWERGQWAVAAYSASNERRAMEVIESGREFYGPNDYRLHPPKGKFLEFGYSGGGTTLLGETIADDFFRETPVARRQFGNLVDANELKFINYGRYNHPRTNRFDQEPNREFVVFRCSVLRKEISSICESQPDDVAESIARIITPLHPSARDPLPDVGTAKQIAREIAAVSDTSEGTAQRIGEAAVAQSQIFWRAALPSTSPKVAMSAKAREFIKQLADLCERYDAGLVYTKDDDGIHLQIDGDRDVPLGFLCCQEHVARDLRALAGIKSTAAVSPSNIKEVNTAPLPSPKASSKANTNTKN
jgi:hypothetical protein